MLLCCDSCVWWLGWLCGCVELSCCFAGGGIYLVVLGLLVAGFSGCFGVLITWVRAVWFGCFWWFVSFCGFYYCGDLCFIGLCD